MVDGLTIGVPLSPVVAHASSCRALVFGEVIVFVVLLALGFVYAWRKGVFRWR